MTTKEITAADIAKELGVNPATARLKLRAAGIRAPYAEKDVPKMKAIIRGDQGPNVKGDAPDKRKAARAKPAKKPKAPVSD